LQLAHVLVVMMTAIVLVMAHLGVGVQELRLRLLGFDDRSSGRLGTKSLVSRSLVSRSLGNRGLGNRGLGRGGGRRGLALGGLVHRGGERGGGNDGNGKQRRGNGLQHGESPLPGDREVPG